MLVARLQDQQSACRLSTEVSHTLQMSCLADLQNAIADHGFDAARFLRGKFKWREIQVGTQILVVGRACADSQSHLRLLEVLLSSHIATSLPATFAPFHPAREGTGAAEVQSPTCSPAR